jgi:hypothetical protein
MDAEGNERWRLEGYLPPDDFRAFLELGLARVAFMKKDWATAEGHFAKVISDLSDSKFVPEAIYYRGVSRYSVSHDGAELAGTAAELAEKFNGSEWQLRSMPWLSE